jgi:hypothetical protein
MARPELTDDVLQALINLSTINGRVDIYLRDNPDVAFQLAEEIQKDYVLQIKPLLEQFANDYAPIKKEMGRREALYNLQKESYG